VKRNIQLPLAQIVRQRRKERGEAVDDHLDEVEVDPEERKRMEAFKSYQAEIGSRQDHSVIGSVKGMSEIMRRSEDNPSDRMLVDDDDLVYI
jgi:hypothetical protein